MNIASFLLPKAEVAYVREAMTLRQGLEKLRRSGYMAIPVLDKDDKYVGVISEGDFLWSIIDYNEKLDEVTMKALEQQHIGELMHVGKITPVCIDTDMEALLTQAQNQNFVPVVDDRGIFIGIITRSDIIKYFVKKQLDSVIL